MYALLYIEKCIYTYTHIYLYVKNHEFTLIFSSKSKITGFILLFLFSIFIAPNFSNIEKSGSCYPQVTYLYRQ